MKTTRLVSAAALTVVAGAALSAAASPIPTAIFTNIATSPTSDVPGLPGFKFNPGATTQFDRPFVSADGQRWVMRAVVDDPTADKDVILTGMVPTGAGAQIVAMEGDPAFFDTSRTYALFRGAMGVNNAGVVAFSGDLAGTSTSDDEFVARWNAGSFELLAQEGSQAIGQAPGVGYGTLANAVRILDDASNTVRFRNSGLIGASTQIAIFELQSAGVGSVLAQTDVTIPADQRVMPEETLDSISSDRFVSSASGDEYMYHGDLNGSTATDLVMVYNGSVVAQEGFPISPEFTSPVTSMLADAGSQQLAMGGGYYLFRGTNADTDDWVVGNGGVVHAATNRPITLNPGETEFFGHSSFAATFFLNVVNSKGDRVIGGVTNAADVDANAVLVYNSRLVVVREGDPVDVDGNGLADDDAHVHIFNNDDAVLTDDGWLIFMADLRDSTLLPIGQAVLRVKICKADWSDDGAVNSNDISAFLTDWLASVGGGHLLADYNNDAAVNSNDISSFLTDWLDAVGGGC